MMMQAAGRMLLAALQDRALAEGGFSDRPGGRYRPDATAWAIIVLSAHEPGHNLLGPARSRLARDQADDGRISIAPDHPEAFWPTPLAVLAWQDSTAQHDQHARAVGFLLRTTGRHWKKRPNDPIAHDSALKGWPWIAETHSWVEPTALSVLALRGAGYDDHARVQEAVHLLIDRQLPHGGWNYGNTVVFGQELRPFPDSTGAALHALAGLVPREQVQRSLEYLAIRIGQARTPIALGWGLLGLGSWGAFPAEARSWVAECLDRQERYGPYDTASLCLLLLPLLSPAGLARVGRNSLVDNAPH